IGGLQDGSLPYSETFGGLVDEVRVSKKVLTPAEFLNSPAATGGYQYAYGVQAQDPDGDTLHYSLTQAPAGMTIDPASGAVTGNAASIQPNLTANGNFTLGNTGFQSDYTFSSTSTAEGRYTVTTNPRLFHPGGASYGDHTTGTGPMLVVNSAVSPNQT